METVTIPKKEYLKLKKLEMIDQDVLVQIEESLKDIEAGRVRRII